MNLQDTRAVVVSGARAAFTVACWSIGTALFGLALSVIGGLLLWDSLWAGVRGGGWPLLAAVAGLLALLGLPLLWWWLGQAHGVNKALMGLLGPRSETLLAKLFEQIEQRNGGRELDAEALISTLREPGKLGGVSAWIVRVLSWQLDLERTIEHLQAAVATPASKGRPPREVLSAALISDLGERWLPTDGWMLWTLLVVELGLIFWFGWR